MDEPKFYLDFEKLLRLHLDPLRQEMSGLRRALEKITVDTVTYKEFNDLKSRLDALETRVNDDIAPDLDNLVDHDRLGLKVIGVLVTIATALVIAYLTGVIAP